MAEDEFGAAEEGESGAQMPSMPQVPTEGIAGIVEKAKSLLPLIIGLAVVAGAIYVYMFVLPKPGTLTITVKEMDTGSMFTDATVSVLDASGKQLSNPLLESGRAAVTVPSGKLKVQVEPGKAGYETVVEIVDLPSGGSKDVTISVAKTADLEFKGSVSDMVIGAGCSQTFTLPLANNGDAPFEAELVADPSDFRKAFTYSGPQTVDSQSTADFKVTVTAPNEGEMSGTIRVKYTAVSMEFSAAVSEPPEMSVDRSYIDIKCSTGGTCDDVTISITNDGKSDLTDLSYTLTGVSEGDVEIVGFESKAIKPRAKTTFFVRGKASGIGKVGKLKITSGCGEEELPITIRS